MTPPLLRIGIVNNQESPNPNPNPNSDPNSNRNRHSNSQESSAIEDVSLIEHPVTSSHESSGRSGSLSWGVSNADSPSVNYFWGTDIPAKKEALNAAKKGVSNLTKKGSVKSGSQSQSPNVVRQETKGVKLVKAGQDEGRVPNRRHTPIPEYVSNIQYILYRITIGIQVACHCHDHLNY